MLCEALKCFTIEAAVLVAAVLAAEAAAVVFTIFARFVQSAVTTEAAVWAAAAADSRCYGSSGGGIVSDSSN